VEEAYSFIDVRFLADKLLWSSPRPFPISAISTVRSPSITWIVFHLKSISTSRNPNNDILRFTRLSLRLTMKPVILCCFLLLAIYPFASAQRFLRSSGQSDTDFRGEMALDTNEALSGMTREMFLMQDVEWELEPPVLEGVDRKLQRHIQKYLANPVQLKLHKKKGKYGMRAIGKMSDGKKLRAFWRQGSAAAHQLKTSEFLEASYDEAVRSRLFTVEFEILLPPLTKGSNALPSVVYQIPVEPGSMNAKSMVPRGAGKVKVYPVGHDAGPAVDAGKGNVGISMRAGLVDPGWAKGRAVFRPGRSLGLL
jgi:hypothetical protein